MFCGDTTLTEHHAGRVEGRRLSCRSWHCDECRPVRLRQLRDIAASGQPNLFITLGSNPNAYDTPDEAAQALVHAWRMVLQRAKRERLLTSIQYLCVFEDFKSGWPHLHILARGPYIPQDWLSDRMAEYCSAPVVWISACRDRRVASRYVAKYISKGPGRFEGCKRYWRSQGYQTQTTEWERETPVHDHRRLFHQRRAESIADAYQRRGWSVTWSSWNRFDCWQPDAECLEPWFDAYIWAGGSPP